MEVEEESSVEAKTETKTKPTRFSIYKILRNVFVGLIALSFGYLHYVYVSTLFENDRNFSHLSAVEREISLRTEMGFYYSYYKTVVEERPFIAGISKLMYDRLVEYPKEVNAFNRFNIAPEVIIGAVYRYFEPWLNTSVYRQCHTVYRGDDVDPVESCVGLGEPILFYLEGVWWLAGLLVTSLFIAGYSLSNSVLGGTLAVVQYFANHAECTRVQWAPNERENMAAPLLLLQTCLVGAQLRRAGTCCLQVSIFVLNCLCLLFWQFSQFIFLTQTAIFFLMEQLGIIDLKALCIFLHSHFCGLHMAVLLLQGNDMLKTSLYASFFLVVSAYCLLFSSLRIKVQNRLDLFVESWLVLLRILIVVTASFYLKHLISDFLQVQDDTHIWDILYSKLTSYKNFHTLLYTCSEAFDFLPLSSVKNMTKTCLIPMAVFSIFGSFYTSFSNAAGERNPKKKVLEDESDSGIENNTDSKEEKPEVVSDGLVRYLRRLEMDPEVVYHASQLAVFAAMAALVMRLKLLLGTHMCVLSALAVNARSYRLPRSIQKYVPLCWGVAISALGYQLYANLAKEMEHIGEFNDFEQEELLHWIMRETGARAAFAGSMPVLATVMLVARRPIVAHPHYENEQARARSYAVYKTYGKFSTEDLYKELTGLKAVYLIVETRYCYGRSRKGCSFEDIWDHETPELSQQPRACHLLLTEHVDHFYPVFRNRHYAVFRVHDYSLRYMPRSFDT